jgi:hypothetical protein
MAFYPLAKANGNNPTKLNSFPLLLSNGLKISHKTKWL